MTCSDHQQLISKFIDKECSAQERVRVKEHLAICGDCRALYESFCRVDSLATAAVFSEFFGESRMEDILETVAAKPQIPFRPRRLPEPSKVLRHPAVSLIAGAAVLLLALSMRARPADIVDIEPNVSEQAADMYQELRSAYERSVSDQQSLQRLNDLLLSLQQEQNRHADEGFDLAVHYSGDTEHVSAAVELSPVVANPDNLLFIVYARAEPDANVLQWVTENTTVPVKGYDVFRAELGAVSPDPDPVRINEAMVTGSAYADTDVKPHTLYKYEVLMHLETGDPLRSRPVKVRSRNDIRLAFNTWQPGEDGQPFAYVSVSRFWHGEWVTESFTVQPGDIIGREIYHAPKKIKIDFSTPYTFVEIEHNVPERLTRRVPSMVYDAATGQPKLDEKGFYIFQELPQEYTENNDRLVYEDGRGGKRILWLHGRPEND